MVLKLYVKDTSAPCRSVYMVVEALGLKDTVEYIHVNLPKKEQLSEAFIKLNPQHTVPTLQDGDFVVWDSHAIVTYLVSQYATEDSLYPKDLKRRAIVDQRLHFNNAILFNTLRETLMPVLYYNEKSFRPENMAKIERAYDFMEKFFKSPWLAAQHITLADICAAATISSLNIILPMNEKTYPNLNTWLERISKEDFYTKGNLQGLEALKTLLLSYNIQFL